VLSKLKTRRTASADFKRCSLGKLKWLLMGSSSVSLAFHAGIVLGSCYIVSPLHEQLLSKKKTVAPGDARNARRAIITTAQCG
jgi:hypothetical protein